MAFPPGGPPIGTGMPGGCACAVRPLTTRSELPKIEFNQCFTRIRNFLGLRRLRSDSLPTHVTIRARNGPSCGFYRPADWANCSGCCESADFSDCADVVNSAATRRAGDVSLPSFAASPVIAESRPKCGESLRHLGGLTPSARLESPNYKMGPMIQGANSSSPMP